MFGRFSGRLGWLQPVLCWGLLWGVWEATAGHIIHLARVPGLPGLIMIPAAFFFMSRAFVRSGRYESIVLTACLAAGIKMFDIFIPGQDLLSVVNPALSILLESLIVAGFYYCLVCFSVRIHVSKGRKHARRG